MVIFKIVFIILLSVPFLYTAGFLYSKARAYSIKQNKEEKQRRKYSGFIDG